MIITEKIMKNMMSKKKRGFRGFYYFRMGYATYFAILMGAINTLSSTYFLSIKKSPWLLDIFPNFTLYVIVLISIGIPLVILTGWLHLKRTGTYAAEADITNEAHPYNYKLAPGYLKEVFGPTYLTILKINIKKAKGEKLTNEEIMEIQKLEDQLTKLIEGGHVGNPPKGAL